MRTLPALLLVLSGSAALAQENGDKGTKRYGVELELARYPQKTAKDTLQSVLKAVNDKRIYYLVAHLSEPDYVDQRIKEYKKELGRKGTEADRAIVAFDRLVREVEEHFQRDPSLLRELHRLAREGEWEEGEERSSVRLKGGSRRAFFRKIQQRWFLENRQQ